MKSIDLHTHTHYSDGGLSPTELVKAAKETGLSAIAITDHDTLKGIPEAIQAGKKYNLEVVPGIEFSTDYKDNDLHLLGYYTDLDYPKLKEQVGLLRGDREEQAKRMVENFQKIGYKLDFDQIREETIGSIGRPHIALAIIENPQNKKRMREDFGEVLKSVEEIFEKYLKGGQPLYENSKTGFRFEVKEAIELIHAAGGLSVLAHPAWDLTVVENGAPFFNKDFLIRRFREFGLDGVEAITFRESREFTKKCIDHFTYLSRDLDLLITGGSDFHGFGSAGRNLGLKEENILMEYDLLTYMKAKLKVAKS